MAVVFSNAGECEALDKLLKDALAVDETYTLKLYKNDYTPTATSVVGDFTEATFTDYVAKTLTRAGWNAATTVAGKASSTYSVAQTWICGATGNTIYGAYILGTTSGVLLWADRFSASVALNNGAQLNYTPTVTLNSEA